MTPTADKASRHGSVARVGTWLSGDGRFERSRLLRAGAATLVSSVVAVLVIRAVARSVVTVPASFTALRTSSVITLTVLGVIAATGACLVLNRRVSRPISTFRRIALVALAISFIPDIAIWASHSHGASAKTVIPLMLMHVAVGSLCLLILPTLGRETRDDDIVAGSPPSAVPGSQ